MLLIGVSDEAHGCSWGMMLTVLNQLTDPFLTASQDFSAAFMTIHRIQEVFRGDSNIPVGSVFQVCEEMMASPAYRRQKQAYFLYRAVAEVLQLVALRVADGEAGDRRMALALLTFGMNQPHASLRRAMAEALGMLPLAVDSAPVPSERMGVREFIPSDGLAVCDLDWLDDHNIQRINGWVWQGRSMLAETRSGGMLVVKCLRADEDPTSLYRESVWMDHLRRLPEPLERPFHIPRPLVDGQGVLIQAPRESRRPPAGTALHPKRYAIAFLAAPAYFHYPNDAATRRRLTGDQFREVLSRNAWLLGRLMAMGIAHTAPIPLFHNRAQRHRREDDGRYRWTHAGRLDRWLASCRYPNFGVSGLRDFEHFEHAVGRTRCRYETIGSHLISLLLVAGSYFRNKAPGRIGFDEAGHPVDTRDLFDRALLQTMVDEIYHAYYQGFTGEAFPEDMAITPTHLADRMIEEMGVDRHMEEILRVADQDAMDPAMFVAFLQSRGIPRKAAARMPKGKDDIPLMTGPHLGGFNQPISLPELIDFAAMGAARCVAGRFQNERGLDH
jgi:hypothetical protein